MNSIKFTEEIECSLCPSLEAVEAWMNEAVYDQPDNWRHFPLCKPCLKQAREDGEEIDSEFDYQEQERTEAA